MDLCCGLSIGSFDNCYRIIKSGIFADEVYLNGWIGYVGTTRSPDG